MVKTYECKLTHKDKIYITSSRKAIRNHIMDYHHIRPNKRADGIKARGDDSIRQHYKSTEM